MRVRGTDGALIWFVWLVLVFAAPAQQCRAGAQASSGEGRPSPANVIAWDPAIIRGVLPNGLRYAVMRNATPTGGVSIRLGMDVGSLDEADDERGAAHFVEHMAFASVRSIGGADLETTFDAAGVEFGRDRNAETSFESTTYRIDLSKKDDVVEGLAFAWLRAVADGTQFTPEGVTHERDVILAERESRLTANKQAQDAFTAFQAGGMRLVDREPIGTADSIASLTPDKLRDFYKRWYTPSKAVVIVVGDQPTDVLVRWVDKTFGSWRATGASPARPGIGATDPARGLDAMVVTEPTIIAGLIVCRLHSVAPVPDDVAQLRQKTLTDLWASMLRRRLDVLAENAASGVAHAEVITSWQKRGLDGVCAGAVPDRDSWALALASIQSELHRFADTSPSEAELEAAIETQRATYRGAVSAADTRRSESLAADILDAELVGDVVPSPREGFRAFDAAVADLTPDALKAAFARDWLGPGPLISLVSPEPVAKEAVLAAWAKGEKLAAAPPSAGPAAAAAWAYADFGRSGHVKHRQAFDKPSFVRTTFANGVTFNFMHTDFEKNDVLVNVVFGAGRREIPDGKLMEAQVGATLLKQQGLGRHDFATLNSLFAQESWGADLNIGNDRFSFSGETSSGGVRDQLGILAAFVTDPGFRGIDPLLDRIKDAALRQFGANPVLVMSQALIAAVDPNGPRSVSLEAQLAGLDSPEMARLLRGPLTEAPLEVTIVGDIDEEKATAAVSATFGALAPRRQTSREQPQTWFLRFPDKTPAPMVVRHDGPAEKAVVGCFWPLYVATPQRRREEYALNLLAHVFADALRHRLRDELGKTYAPSTASFMPDFADQGYLVALVDASPADVDQMRLEIGKVADRLAHGGFSDADVESVRVPMLAQFAQSEQTNKWWVGGLSGSARDRTTLNDLVSMRATYASITPAEVRKAAATWLISPPYVITALPRGANGQGPAGR